MSSIQWDGVVEHTGNFLAWWNAVMGATSRINGMAHIELTANILWQIWKNRNDWNFNAKQRHPMKAVQKAQQEWQEQVTVRRKNERMSSADISGAREEPVAVEEGSADIQIRVTTQVQKDSSRVGMGIIATNSKKQVVIAWALNDRTSGSQLQVTAKAVKLAIIKAKKQQWQEIKVRIPIIQVLKEITSRKTRDIRMATLIDDINNLRSLFQKCSFCLDRIIDHRCKLINDYALDIFQDEEWINPQCTLHFCIASLEPLLI
nr:uncharacterized protein LOC113700360 [Coffea arabica]